MQLKVGKYYRTRDGRKAGPLELVYNTLYPYKCPNLKIVYAEEGTFWHPTADNCYARHSSDLVAEWVDKCHCGFDNVCSLCPPDVIAVNPKDVPKLFEVRDEEIVSAFNALVKAGRVQLYGNDFLHNPVTLKPAAPRELTLPDSGYRVVVEGETVKVGCQEFERPALFTALKNALDEDVGPDHSLHGFQLYATRRYIIWNGNRITWADADALLKFLEEK